MAEEFVIFDIDGTLADVSERIHHVRKKPKNWDAFFKGMAQDKAIHSIVRFAISSMLPESKSFSAQGGMRSTAQRLLNGWLARA